VLLLYLATQLSKQSINFDLCMAMTTTSAVTRFDLSISIDGSSTEVKNFNQVSNDEQEVMDFNV
jgi:hypothetical protein